MVGTTVMPSLEWLRVPFLGIYPTIQSLAPQAVLILLLLIALIAKLRPSAVSRQPDPLEPPAVSSGPAAQR